jgi:alpha-L-fucosidase 2
MLSAALLAASITATKGSIDVYILSGQSNMQGIAKTAKLPADWKQPIEGALFFGGWGLTGITPGTTQTSNRKGEFGPEIGFARVASMLSDGKPFAIIKYAASGQPLHHGFHGAKWLGGEPAPDRTNFYPGELPNDPNQGRLYKNLVKRVDEGLAALRSEGYEPKVIGVAWMQGEADAKNALSAVSYAESIGRLQRRISEDFGSGLPIPLSFGQVLPKSEAPRFTHKAEIRRAMANADMGSGHTRAQPHVYMVSTDRMGMLPDGVHYNASGQKDLGQSLALVMEMERLKSKAPRSFPELQLWYRQPAKNWLEALPIGNGRLGAMVFGGTNRERIQLNEESLWAGRPVESFPENFAENLKKLQDMVFEGRSAEARAFGIETMTANPTSFRSFQPLGDLWIEMDGQVKNYRRSLDLTTGIAKTQFRLGDAVIFRDVFISAPDDVLVVRLTSDKKSAISCGVSLTRKKDLNVVYEGSQIIADGQIMDDDSPGAFDDNPGGSGPGGAHMKFATRVQIAAEGGSVETRDDRITVTGADEVTIILGAATDYSLDDLNFNREIDPAALAQEAGDKAAARSSSELEGRHTEDHAALMDRVKVNLGRNAALEALPTDERLQAVRQGAYDPALDALIFQFGRYLLMGSSRAPGRLPANLQGIWNDRMWAPWEADHHMNINLQMNYWPADLTNLSETLDPLTGWLIRLAKKAEYTAEHLYNADGWLAYTATNPFGRITPSASTRPSQFMNGSLDPLAGAWMSMTLWRHYEFTEDKAYLKDTAYPVIKGAAEFLLDYMREDADGNLVIVPSTSPENDYRDPKTGKSIRITVGSAYHMSIVREVLTAALKGAKITRQDRELQSEIEAALAKIAPLKIGKDGTINEWAEDYEEVHPGHRHVSHLIGLHPFNQITASDPVMFEAAQKTLKRRLDNGGGHTGWSRAWNINFLARLKQGDAARENVVKLLQRSTHPNLFGNHPPFQIDGNFGATAGIAEMLLQSHDGVIELLPALPAAWHSGQVQGLVARGGVTVSMIWSDGRLYQFELKSDSKREIKVRYGDEVKSMTSNTGGMIAW